MAWRFVVYGFLAPLVGSLLDGLINQEEYAGLMLVLAVLPLWALLAIQLPQSVPQKIVRAVVCVAAPVFAICFYVVSRSLVNYGDGVRATFLQVPFLDLLRLPSWYDQFGVDVYLKAALLTSFFLVGLLSAAYFLTQRLHSQQPV